MNIQDFKQELLNGTLNEDLIIFVCPENTFIAETYIDEICAQKNLTKNYISSLSETTESALALVMDFTEDLNILKVETFEEISEDYSKYKNCVVFCKKVAPAILEQVKEFIVEVPKLLDWQIKDFIKVSCPGLTDADIDWLYECSNKNIFKIKNELDKISLVAKEKQSEALKYTGTDLFVQRPVFDLVDALVKGDEKIAAEFLKHAEDYTNLDPVGLTTLTLSKFKNILLLCFKSGVKESELGLSSGAIWHVKNDNRNIPLDRIQKAIAFLSNIDSRLKTNPSSLDFLGNRKTALLEYIIIGTLACSK